jgi:hypothetical protein
VWSRNQSLWQQQRRIAGLVASQDQALYCVQVTAYITR